jgi:hypothetical protein
MSRQRLVSNCSYSNATKPLGIASWEALLRANLGEDVAQQRHARLDGAAPLPASDAFGPCFKRISQPMRRYEFGFAPSC